MTGKMVAFLLGLVVGIAIASALSDKPDEKKPKPARWGYVLLTLTAREVGDHSVMP